ncbi:MAG: DUF294 nucleotidyltransferase-like domain-containing protein [Wenzhouxiangellaceae bacterium]|nr:DUF294 nucleotidyltransferase-like domain-containing protein [Wenzhouxiangellaceae bacterium]
MARPPSDVTGFLVHVAPFSELDGLDIERVAGLLEMRYHSRDHAIGCFDPPGRDGLFIVRKGAVVLSDSQSDVAIEQRGEGELFGHRIRFRDGIEGYRVRASEDCLVWHLPQDRLDELLTKHQRLARFFHDAPGERLRFEIEATTRQERLSDLPLRSPVTIGPAASIRECAGRMREFQVSSLPIVENDRLTGIITDRDLRNRVVAVGRDPESPVADIMTSKPATAGIEDRIEAALVEMMRLGIHHLPVLDADGGLRAVVSAGDLMRVQSPHPLRLVRDLHRAENREMVIQLARRAPGMLAAMARSGSGASEVGRIASRITDACTRRLLTLAIQELGEAPMAWSWLAFGSQARMEQGLISDQDNGLLLAEKPDEPTAAYFLQLATRVCDDLNECGYVHCPGGVMAKGEWRMSQAAWRRRFEGWIREPEPKSVMQSSIFFDMRPVAGDLELGHRLHREVLALARDSQIFRRFLAQESLHHRPPIGLFRRFVQEHGGEHSQGLNLKKRGVIPVVDLARVRALEEGFEVIHTEERIHAAADAGHINSRDAGDLVHALKFIADVRLQHQARRLDRGLKPDHLVDPDELSGLHRRYLRSAFAIIGDAQSALAQRYLL